MLYHNLAPPMSKFWLRHWPQVFLEQTCKGSEIHGDIIKNLPVLPFPHHLCQWGNMEFAAWHKSSTELQGQTSGSTACQSGWTKIAYGGKIQGSCQCILIRVPMVALIRCFHLLIEATLLSHSLSSTTVGRWPPRWIPLWGDLPGISPSMATIDVAM